MKENQKGWVIISIGHPNAKIGKFILPYTFEQTRKDCIRKFIEGSNNSWEFWKRKFNYRCVKASQTVTTI